VTDTIGWGDVDRPPRLPRVLPARLRLNRRRRIALVVVAALVAGGIVAWPSFRSWRANDAARQVQRIWTQMQGLDDSRVVLLDSTQRALGPLDRAAFVRAVVVTEDEEAADLDRLARQARAMRTWTADVAAARNAVVAALVTQAKALRAQAATPADLTIDMNVLTSLDDAASGASDAAANLMERLQSRYHLKDLATPNVKFPASASIVAALRRPTDEPLHLRLVSTDAESTVVTDLDTGRVLVRRTMNSNDSAAWEPDRVVGGSLLGGIDADTVFVPLDVTSPQRLIANTSVQSSVGSPIWLASYLDNELQAYDASGRRVGRGVPLPAGVNSTSLGTPTALLVTSLPPPNSPIVVPSRFYLFHPATGVETRLATTGCPQLVDLQANLVVLPTGPQCDYADELELYDLSGRFLRTVPLPGGEVLASSPITSPDGMHVAVVTAPRPVPGQDMAAGALRLLDTRTGSWTTVPRAGGWFPLHWSSDGRVLLVQSNDNDFNPAPQSGHLGYLRMGEMALHSIRVMPGGIGNFLS